MLKQITYGPRDKFSEKSRTLEASKRNRFGKLNDFRKEL